MHPTDPTPLDSCFQEGLEARAAGKALCDNPYAAGSDERREWRAGFCATVADRDDLELDSDDGPDRRPSE